LNKIQKVDQITIINSIFLAQILKGGTGLPLKTTKNSEGRSGFCYAEIVFIIYCFKELIVGAENGGSFVKIVWDEKYIFYS
jgi:hypothetical protein